MTPAAIDGGATNCAGHWDNAIEASAARSVRERERPNADSGLWTLSCWIVAIFFSANSVYSALLSRPALRPAPPGWAGTSTTGHWAGGPCDGPGLFAAADPGRPDISPCPGDQRFSIRLCCQIQQSAIALVLFTLSPLGRPGRLFAVVGMDAESAGDGFLVAPSEAHELPATARFWPADGLYLLSRDHHGVCRQSHGGRFRSNRHARLTKGVAQSHCCNIPPC